MPRMQASLLADGRLHLNDGPIDLIVFAEGDRESRARAYDSAVVRFSNVLDELCSELSLLRAPCSSSSPQPAGAVARRMDQATRPLGDHRFITRMASVAGAVADEILSCMLKAAPFRRAYVNNGGDIALHLAGAASLNIGLVDDPVDPALFGISTLKACHGVGGVATSGWRGRSFSLGIADAVTVLARNAASADAAATLVANAVDLPGHDGIIRAPACDFDPQSDLGRRLVTRGVGQLSDAEIEEALGSGAREALRLIEAGAIVAASLRLQGTTRVVGRLPSERPAIQNDAPRYMPERREDMEWRLTSARS